MIQYNLPPINTPSGVSTMNHYNNVPIREQTDSIKTESSTTLEADISSDVFSSILSYMKMPLLPQPRSNHGLPTMELPDLDRPPTQPRVCQTVWNLLQNCEQCTSRLVRVIYTDGYSVTPERGYLGEECALERQAIV